jgi:hypothetical protein
MSSELATSYAALILADDGIEISVKYRTNSLTGHRNRLRMDRMALDGIMDTCISSMDGYPNLSRKDGYSLPRMTK